MPNAKPEKIIEALWSSGRDAGTHIYVVLDGARNDGIYPAAIESGCECECLYRGELAPDLAEAAPYLLKLTRDHPFTYWLVGKGWGDSWGIFVRTPATLRDLRHHFRKFLMVYSPEAKPMYFRYYDPRVLRVFLPTCNAQELAAVFGPVTSFVLEDADADTMLVLSDSSGTLQVQRTALLQA
jgi:hypothetical protein